MASSVISKKSVMPLVPMPFRSTTHMNTCHTTPDFLQFIAPVWEHDLTVVKFPEDKDEKDNSDITKQFKKHNDEWVIVDYDGGNICEFCKTHHCDRAQYRDELEGMFKEVSEMEVPAD